MFNEMRQAYFPLFYPNFDCILFRLPDEELGYDRSTEDVYS